MNFIEGARKVCAVGIDSVRGASGSGGRGGGGGPGTEGVFADLCSSLHQCACSAVLRGRPMNSGNGQWPHHLTTVAEGSSLLTPAALCLLSFVLPAALVYCGDGGGVAVFSNRGSGVLVIGVVVVE